MVGDHFHLEKLLRSNQQTTVWLARDTETGRQITAKKIEFSVDIDATKRDEILGRAQRACWVIANISNKHIVPILDVVKSPGAYWITMEYIDAESAESTVRKSKRGFLSPGEVLRIGEAVLEALVDARRERIIHRDVKPSSILIRNNDRQILLTDFDITHDANETTWEPGTAETRQFTSPEQREGRPPTSKSDVYSLGKTLRYLADGRPDAGSQQPPTPDRARLEPLFARMEERDAARRLDASEALIQLRGLIDDPTVPPQEPGIPRGARYLIASLIAIVLILIIILVTTVPGGDGQQPPEADAILKDTACNVVTIYTGQRHSPYYNYGEIVERWLKDAKPGLEVKVEPTTGSKYNLDEVNRSSSNCGVAVAQFTTAVDGVNGRGPWAYEGTGGQGPKLSNLASVGPIFYDLVHVIVRDKRMDAIRTDDMTGQAGALKARKPALISQLEDLCNAGVRVAMGHRNSGVFQIAQVVENLLGCTWQEDVEDNGAHIPYSLSRLRDGWVDAVFWVGGSPTSFIENFAVSALARRDADPNQSPPADFRLLPLRRRGQAGPDETDVARADDCDPKTRGQRLIQPHSFLQEMEHDFDNTYCIHAKNGFYPGSVYDPMEIQKTDYNFSGDADTSTVAVPNGLVVNKTADGPLVHFLVDALDKRRGELQDTLWRNTDVQGNRGFPEVDQLLGNPIFCFVPLHEAAVEYYGKRHKDCAESRRDPVPEDSAAANSG